ncbi:hypothetical protein JOB18_020067 [Solea senegalensis]|uniref:Uncharacterized protein n=1 Tax=Solea senegalensis TaxID=28829 RepID=A0AAV6SX65_SOLSE|nr:hypothetical protein JOB18_020067 [Solea senegalensis]
MVRVVHLCWSKAGRSVFSITDCITDSCYQVLHRDITGASGQRCVLLQDTLALVLYLSRTLALVLYLSCTLALVLYPQSHTTGPVPQSHTSTVMYLSHTLALVLYLRHTLALVLLPQSHTSTGPVPPDTH